VKIVTGIQEILILVIIVLAIFFVPRILDKGNGKKPPKPALVVSGKMRLAITASVFWLLLAAAVLQPWNQNMVLFLYAGLGPVVSAWIINWVVLGFRKYKR